MTIVLLSAAMVFVACGVRRGAESPPAGPESDSVAQESPEESEVAVADTVPQAEGDAEPGMLIPVREECGVANEVHFAMDDGTTVVVRVGQPLAEVFAQIGYPRADDGRVLDEPDDWRDPDSKAEWRRGNVIIGWGYSLTNDDSWLYMVDMYHGGDATLGNGLAPGAMRNEVLQAMGPPDRAGARGKVREAGTLSYLCDNPRSELDFAFAEDRLILISVECDDCRRE